MRYSIKQKAISVGDDFSILDEKGKQAFFVDGNAFGNRLTVYDSQKKAVAIIKKKLFSVGPAYRILENNIPMATIKKSRFSFRPRFIIDIPGPRDYEVIGNFHKHEYTFTRNRVTVATVSKKFFATTDCYGVDISGGNPLLILCTAIVIDQVLHI